MHLRPGTTFELKPKERVTSALCGRLLDEFRATDFASRRLTRVLAAFFREDPSLEELFDLAGAANGGALASPRLLYGVFGARRNWTAEIASSRVGRVMTFPLQTSDVAAAVELVRSALADDSRAFRARWGGAAPKEIVDLLTASQERAGRASAGRWGSLDRAGIMRREHASLLFRCGDSSLLLDPQGSRRAWSSHDGRTPVDDAMPMQVDAILVTHSHEDHWHLPSLLRYRTRRLIVPEVSRPSLLCPTTFSDVLRTAQVPHETRPWGSTVRIGAFQVDVLPFYGEQPVCEPPWTRPKLRSWGNCYRVNCKDYSAIVLVDSGADPSGSMIDVLRQSSARRGPVDFLFSSSFEFPEVIFDGLPEFFLTVPWGRVERTWARMKRGDAVPSVTLGPPGIRDACEASGARFWAPYGQGFRGIGKAPYNAEAGNRSEAETVRSVGRLLRERRCDARVVSWRPGDAMLIHGTGRVFVRRIAQAP